jgi:hypothetical protein
MPEYSQSASFHTRQSEISQWMDDQFLLNLTPYPSFWNIVFNRILSKLIITDTISPQHSKVLLRKDVKGDGDDEIARI